MKPRLGHDGGYDERGSSTPPNPHQFGLDALLGRWPALEPQQKGGPSWDERADAIVAAAVARKAQGASAATEALLAPPPLEAEPGEEKAPSFQFQEAARPVTSDGAAGRASAPNLETAGATSPMANDQGKKPSLKELAARASQAGAARGSIPPGARASTPPPARISSIPNPASGATVTPISRAKPPVSAGPRASDPGREDSGILRLADIQAEEAAKAEAAAVAAETALAAAKQSEKPAVGAPVVVAPAAVAANTGNKAGMWAGVAIAVMGIAAAFAVYRTRQPEVAPSKTDTVAAVQTSKPAVLPAQTGAQAADQPAVVASSEAAPAASDAPKTEPAPGTTGTAAASATAVAEVKPSAPSAAEPKGSKVGTLDEEMKKAVGSSESQPAPADESKPAAGGSGGALPDQPSQGNAQAAVRSVLPGARACVAGATETSSASVTFSSSGSVQSVSVGGWAAQNGKTGCVKSALQGAHVAPFAKPSFTVPVTIRP